jgi:hypothetical protein
VTVPSALVVDTLLRTVFVASSVLLAALPVADDPLVPLEEDDPVLPVEDVSKDRILLVVMIFPVR